MLLNKSSLCLLNFRAIGLVMDRFWTENVSNCPEKTENRIKEKLVHALHLLHMYVE